jgi:hypothetical protein
MIYTGIGSRTTPPVILDLMLEIGRYFGKHGVTLRSGGAPGADIAFEQGCDSAGGPKQIFFPTKIWMGKDSSLRTGTYHLMGPDINLQEASIWAQRIWTYRNLQYEWNRLKPFTKLLMIRNSLQILGPQMVSPTKLIICWTTNGELTGGTGQTMMMAEHINHSKEYDYVIPIINLQIQSHRDAIRNLLSGNDPNSFIDTVQNILQKRLKKRLHK